MISTFANRHWYRFTPLTVLLYPFSLMFGLLVWARRFLYKRRILLSYSVPVPVIVVGNVTVGGTGKTPLVLWLVRALKKMGYEPGVIASGYGGTAREAAEIGPGDDPRIRGDEAVQMAQRCGVPVWAGRKRVQAAKGLLRAHPECNLLICDDGLQHYRLCRDIEIAVEDERGVGNGCYLPAGPLREPETRSVDAIVVNSLHPVARGKYRMSLKPAGFFRLGEPESFFDVTQFRGKRIHAMAGIGEPERFFATLRSIGIHATTHAFADHHDFQRKDLVFDNCDVVLMTEKDAVKCASLICRPIPFGMIQSTALPGADDPAIEGEWRGGAGTEYYALRVEAEIDVEFLQVLEKRLNGLTAA